MGLLNPVTTVLPLRDSLQGRDRSGLFSATATGPVRYDDNGLIVEPGVTNYVPNPVGISDGASWGVYSSVAITYGVPVPGPLPGWLANLVTTCVQFEATVDTPVGPYSIAQSPNATLPSATPHVSSMWIWIPTAFSGSSLTMYHSNFVGATGLSSAIVNLALRDQWQWVRNITVTPDAGDFSGTINLRNFDVGGSPMLAGERIYCVLAQTEPGTISTSSIVGSMGPGYSWAGTPHNSASVRAATVPTIPIANHLSTIRGSVIARVRLHYDTGNANQRLLSVGEAASNDWLGMYARSVATDLVRMQSIVSGGTARNVTTTAPTIGTRASYYGEWGSEVGVAVGGGSVARVNRVETPTGVTTGSSVIIGRLGSSEVLGGSISDLLIYDAPLSDTRHAIVLDALANDADMDELWELFEEWEAVGIAADTLQLQSGSGTAGVTAIAEPLDLPQLQDGQGTAGVRGEGQARELVELQAGMGAGFDGSQVIPAGRVR